MITMNNIEQIIQLLAGYQFQLSDEKILQRQIETVLTENNIEFKREVRLEDRSIIDFVVDDIGIEVKIKGQSKAIYRQCKRYCESGKIKTLILISNKTMGFPESIGDIPVYVINLGYAHL